MNTLQLLGKGIMFILFLSICLQAASALGISPAGKAFLYSEGSEQSLTILVYNGEAKEMNVSLFIEGDIDVRLSESQLHFTKDDEVLSVTATFTMPEGLTPGNHIYRIVAQEKVEQSGSISALAAVSSSIKIQVPYPEKYLVTSLYGQKTGDDVMLTVPITNKGVIDITQVSTVLEIENVRLSSAPISLARESTEKLSFVWPHGSEGEFATRILLDYDGQSQQFNHSVIIGTPHVDVKNISLPDFTRGEINRVLISVESNWNSPLEVFADVSIADNNNTIATYQTATATVDKLGQLEVFWDTSSTDQEQFFFTINLHYTGVEHSITRPIYVGTTESITTSGSDYTAILITVLVLGCIILIGLYYYRRKLWN